MNVGVAVLALRAYITEYKISVAVRASHLDVHSAQGEPGLFVFKLRDRANRFPALGSVAVLAGDLQGSVRTMRVSIRGWRLFISCSEADLKKKCQMHQQEHSLHSCPSPCS